MLIKAAYIEPPVFRRERLRAFFTTKRSGTDRKMVSRHAGIHEKQIFYPVQKHTGKVHMLRKNDREKIADAVITSEKDVLLGVKVADCVPVLIHDMVRDVCAAVHAGWRGTADGIVSRTLEMMFKHYYCDPDDLVIAIGPAIRWCCYEIGEDVLNAVRSASGKGEYFMKRNDVLCLDLPSANRAQTLNMGVPGENIWMSGECTYCDHERFYSYRYSRFVFGNQGGFIGIVTR